MKSNKQLEAEGELYKEEVNVMTNKEFVKETVTLGNLIYKILSTQGIDATFKAPIANLLSEELIKAGYRLPEDTPLPLSIQEALNSGDGVYRP